jgi:ribosomal protein S18 acetylase RimI-like enzyme
MKNILRLLTVEDAADFKRFRLKGLQSFPTSFCDTAEAFTQKSDVEVASWIESDTKDGGFLLGAYSEFRTMIGTVGICRDSVPNLRHRANLWGMLVDPSCQGCGVAKALLQEAIRICREGGTIEQIHLSVTTTCEPAIGLYEKVGFKKAGTERKKIKIQDCYHDMYLMILDLI